MNRLFTIAQIAETVGGKIDGDSDLTIKGVCDLINSRTSHIAYILSEKYEKYFHQTKADAIIVKNDFSISKGEKTLIRVDNPAISFINIIKLFNPDQTEFNNNLSNADISNTAKMGKNVQIAANAVIDNNANIEDNVQIGPSVYIGSNSNIGKGTIIHPNVTIYHNVTIGSNCIIDAGTVIGSDGFGLVSENNIHHKIPHIGKVIIEDNVWIGSNCCIDRGTLNNTQIGEGSKLDNLIHIAHNVIIGKNCIIAGQVGIAGSTILEENVTLAGQVGLIGHLRIGSGATIASKSAVFQSVNKDASISGIPARPHKQRIRQDVIISQLPEIINRIRKLEKKLI